MLALSVEAPDGSDPSELGGESFSIADHFTEAEILSLCGMGTLSEAVIAVVSRFTPLSRAWKRSAHKGQEYVMFAREEDGWAKVRFTRANTSEWVAKEARHPHGYALDLRRAILEEVLGQVKRYEHLSRRLAKPFTPLAADSDASKRADRELARASLIEEYNAVVGLWWDIRLSQGFAPEAAQMLLGLTLPIETLQRLVFPTDASPYVPYSGSCPFTPPRPSSL